MGALDPYPSPKERDEERDALAEALGAEVREYGRSVEDRPLIAVRVPSTRESSEKVAVCANIHGIEFIGNRVAHAFLRALHDVEEGRTLRQRAEVWVVPCVNPDGYARTWAQQGQGRARDMRKNANGVDLNRNFLLPYGAEPSWVPTSGSYGPDDATYRGEAPFSEPETRQLAALFDEVRPRGSANLHSFMGTMIPARCPEPGEARTYRQLFQPFQQAQRHARYRLLQTRFDVFTGEQEDYQHHVQGTWAACVESFPVTASFRQHLLAPSTFWRFNPHDPAPWIDNDVPAVLAFLHATLDIDRPPSREGALKPRTTWRQDGAR